MTKIIGSIYNTFPVVSTNITVKEIVILDYPDNMPQEPRKANLLKKSSINILLILLRSLKK